MDWIDIVIASAKKSENVLYCDNCGDAPHAEIDGWYRCCVCGKNYGKKSAQQVVSGDLLPRQANKLNFDTTASEQPPTSSNIASA